MLCLPLPVNEWKDGDLKKNTLTQLVIVVLLPTVTGESSAGMIEVTNELTSHWYCNGVCYYVSKDIESVLAVPILNRSTLANHIRACSSCGPFRDGVSMSKAVTTLERAGMINSRNIESVLFSTSGSVTTLYMIGNDVLRSGHTAQHLHLLSPLGIESICVEHEHLPGQAKHLLHHALAALSAPPDTRFDLADGIARVQSQCADMQSMLTGRDCWNPTWQECAISWTLLRWHYNF